MRAAAAYLALTKPRLLPLVLLSGLPALVLAAGHWPSPLVIAGVLIGTSLAAGAANALNCYCERDADALMERTGLRPLPAGQLSPQAALGFGLTLSAIASALLWRVTGLAAALIALATILSYVFVYTLWLKPRTPLAVIAGGISGAAAPLIADAAADGRLGAAGWILFAIIFLWQPPHFYAIGLYRRSDYARAGFPMLHDRIGEEATRRRIVLWILALVPVTLAPVALSMFGGFYAIVASGMSLLFVGQALRLWRRREACEARRLFLVSLLFLMGVFAAMLVELIWSALG
jgi:protoheme IX farnesyltransferase